MNVKPVSEPALVLTGITSGLGLATARMAAGLVSRRFRLALGTLLVFALHVPLCRGENPSRGSAGKTYVITGASSGFGRGVAVKLGGRGGNVVLAARRAGVLEEVAREVRAAGGQALVVPTDVSRPEQVERLVRAAVARFGRVDVWINDAAVGIAGRFWEVPVADTSRAVDVNLKGVIYGSHAALRQFVAQGGGVLINLGSVESVVPIAYHNVYAATKAGVLALDMAIIQELRLSGLGDKIKVATIMPWAVDTPWWGHAANYLGRTQRMIAVDDPSKVVDAIVDNTERPQRGGPRRLEGPGRLPWSPDLARPHGAALGEHLSPRNPRQGHANPRVPRLAPPADERGSGGGGRRPRADAAGGRATLLRHPPGVVVFGRTVTFRRSACTSSRWPCPWPRCP